MNFKWLTRWQLPFSNNNLKIKTSLFFNKNKKLKYNQQMLNQQSNPNPNASANPNNSHQQTLPTDNNNSLTMSLNETDQCLQTVNLSLATANLQQPYPQRCK